MLQVEHLTISHRRDLRLLVESLSFVLNSGDKLAVIGEEGNGKSSLLKVLADFPIAPDYVEISGHVSCEGRIGYLAQFIDAHDLSLSVYEYICGTSFPAWQAINEAALRVRIAPEFLYDSRPLGSFSGGERTKIQLCRLLVSEPSVLLLDEPSNDLDIDTLIWLEQFISEETRPLLFVSHDETLLRQTANSILHIEQLHRRKTPRWTLARLGLEAYLSEYQKSYDRTLRLAESDRREHEAKMERYQRIEQSVEHQQQAISRGNPAGGRLLKKKMHAVKSMERRFEKEFESRTRKPDKEESVVLFADPKISHHADKEILDLSLDVLSLAETDGGLNVLARDIHLHVLGQDKIAIIGKNGCGKSTLLKQVNKALQDRSDLKLAYMPQDYADELPLDLLPLDFLAPSGRQEEQQRALDMLGCMKFSRHEMLHAIKELSGGQQAKLFMLRFILQQADVWILDEPTRNFSPLSAPVVRDVLRAFNGAIISVSHDRLYLAEVASTVYQLRPDGLYLDMRF